MRRSDREIRDRDEIQALLGRTGILHLALFDEDYPYLIPLHYASEFDGDKLVFYMHCAKEGQKLDLIRKNPRACIEIENDVQPVSGGDVPCRYGACYFSVIARGKIRILEDREEKKKALKLFMKHQTGRDFEFSEDMADSAAVLAFTADSYSAKARKPRMPAG